MTIEQIIVLAIVQGITEFLPISSSGHLILIPAFTGWPDQGVVTDVMVHVGSLFAVIAYFWRDVLKLIGGGIDLLRLRINDNSRMAGYILLATIPAVLFGIFLNASGLGNSLRSVELVAWNAVIFGILLYAADVFGPHLKKMEDMKLAPALIIGVAQALALIPGTSRSGITMTAARLMGFERPEAARFSFLLGIPAIAGAGAFVTLDFLESGQQIPPDAIWAAALTFLAALAAIALLMAMVKRVSFLIFMIYRLLLALLLFAMLYDWVPGLPGLAAV
ncbi:undecaprenyl-diphosphate phosphatase [Salaquimonas pukyongi]|uniref:undecaprenyl-diphosphate phosphatase n=1 Tax=Salaquimonas pukyongi TaxID=2712698 RepID=UPI00096BC8AC|nr:undecaprenyl-diphosphate phosphatase [Salaquimonas pukyongi]